MSLLPTRSSGQLSSEPFAAAEDSRGAEEDADDDAWSLLDEFRHHCGLGNLSTVKRLVQYVQEKQLPAGFESEWEAGQPYPYTLTDLNKKAVDEDGNTPLHFACANGHVEVANFLVETLHASCVKNKVGNTPLHWAAENGQGEAVKWICETFRDMDVLEKNAFGRSAVSSAMESENEQAVIAILGHSSAEPPADFVSFGPEDDDEDKQA